MGLQFQRSFKLASVVQRKSHMFLTPSYSSSIKRRRPMSLSCSKHSFLLFGIIFVLLMPSVESGGVFGSVMDWLIEVAKNLELTVYPGTHYCGLQSSSEHRSPESEIDHCCYYHDKCSQFAIMSHSERYGIVNPHSYPIHPCECNEKFTSCLHQIDSLNAGVVANLYYDLVNECIVRNSTGQYCCLVPQQMPL